MQAEPDQPVALNLLGVIASQVGKNDIAIELITKALAIKPDYAEAHNNHGNAFNGLGKLDEAVASYQKALAINPDYTDAHFNLGVAFKELGKLDEAVASYREALAINPDYSDAHNNLGIALRNQGKLGEAVASYQKALAINPDFAECHSSHIFSMSYIPEITSEDIFEEARQWDARHGYHGEIPKHRNTPEPDRRLRVGLVSGDLRHHSVSYFLEDILSEIDKEELEIFAYATSAKEDDLTDCLKSIVANWRNVTGIGDKQLAEGIIADGIDILIDLSGHTSHNRLRMFSRKPAPIQITWLGYNGTTGVEAIDYIFCDRLVLPPSVEAYYVEKPWRLPDIWVCFSPPGLDIDVGALPALANGHITFGSFNNLTKITGRTVACWAKVLQGVPDSRLLLKAEQLEDKTVQEETLAGFEAHGIARQRLILKSRSPDKTEHLRTYNEMDIALDPFPYAGVTTSIEAFWMGAPVLTLKGDSFVSCAGESLLQNVGLGAWIADTPEDYVEKTIAFASDLAALSGLRESLRNRLLESPICDTARFARNLEDAFRGMWREWCGRNSASRQDVNLET